MEREVAAAGIFRRGAGLDAVLDLSRGSRELGLGLDLEVDNPRLSGGITDDVSD